MIKIRLTPKTQLIRLKTRIQMPNIMRAKLQNKTVKASTEQQIVQAKQGYDGLEKVVVEAVSSDIDTNIKPENIVKGKNILGVEGNSIKYNLEDGKQVTPKTEAQIIFPDEGYDAVKRIIVEKVDNTIDPNIAPQNIVKDVSILGVIGSYEGVIPEGTVNITAEGLYNVSKYENANVKIASESTNNTMMFVKNNEDTKNAGYQYSQLQKMITKLPDEMDFSNITDYSYLFNGCYSLEKIPNIIFNKNASINYSYMFSDCHKIKELPDLSNINASNITGIFRNCFSIEEEPNITLKNALTEFTNVFNGCKKLTKISKIDTSKVQQFNSTFAYCENLKIIDIDTSNATRYFNTFKGCKSLEQIPNINFSNVTDISYSFQECSSLKNVNITIDAPKCTNFTQMFRDCANLSVAPEIVNYPNNSVSYNGMFQNCSSLKELPNIDFTNANNVSNLFLNCGFENLETTLYFPKVTSYNNCNYIFSNCKKLKKAKIDATNMRHLSNLFSNCPVLEEVEIKVSTNTKMFDRVTYRCPNLRKMVIDGDLSQITSYSNNFNGTATNISSMTLVFKNCPVLNLSTSFIQYLVFGKVNIYVDDDKVNDWKTTGIFKSYSNYIFPISELSEA